MEKINYKLLNFLLIIIAVFFVSKSINIYKDLILLIIEVLFPILLSFFISYSLYPCVKYFTRKVSYKVACLIVITLCISIVGLLLIVSIPIFTKEFSEVINELLLFLDKFSFSVASIKNYILSYLSIDNGLALINTGALFITKFVIVIVLSICFLFNMEKIKSYLKKYELFNLIDRDLFCYYKGFYLVILLEILEYLIIYFLIGHPYFILLAILAGITSVIPFFGSLFTNTLALITSLSISFPLFIATSIVLILVPLFNSYVVEPRVYNKTLKISLTSVIISCFVCGYLFGFFGILFSLPFYLILKNLCRFFLVKAGKV